MRDACKVAYFGWYEKYGDYVISGGTMSESNKQKKMDYVFTQQMIWEVLDQSDAKFRDSSIQKDYVSFKAEINEKIANMKLQPSFINNTITINAGETKTITDTNNVLKDYVSFDKSIDGIRIQHTKGQNTMKITVSEECTQETYRISESTMKNWGIIKEESENHDTTVYFTFEEGVQNQLYALNYNDPVSMLLDLKINSFDLEKYIIFLADKLQNDSKTRNRKLSSCKRFFEYLYVNNLINSNPSKRLTSARTEKRIPKYLDLNESKKLLSVTINSEQVYRIRNYAITCIFLNCSIRLSELTGINLTDIKIDNSEKTIRIHGKGNKERLLYLNAAVCEAINAYIEVRPKLGKEYKDYNALFLSSRNKRIANRTVETIIKENLSKTIDDSQDLKDYKTHTLRHTGVSLLYNENNVDIFTLKRILGHKSLDATQIYTHVSNKKMKEIMMNCTISSIIEKKEKN